MRKANAGLLKMLLLKKIYFFCSNFILVVCSSSSLLLAQGNLSLPADGLNKVNKQLFIFHNSTDVAKSIFLKHLTNELGGNVDAYPISSLDITNMPLSDLSPLTESSANNCIITVGSDALKKAVATRNKIPIFSTLVSKHSLDRIIQNYQRFGSKIGGIYYEQSFNRQLLLAKAIDPEIESALIFLNRQTRYQLGDYKNVALNNAIKLKFYLLTPQASPQGYFAKNTTKKAALILINEPVHHDVQDLQSLLITSYNKQVPMIGNKKTDSIHAAMVSIYTPLNTLAKEVSRKITDFCQTNKSRIASFSEDYQIEINQQIADYLNYKNIDKQKLLADILRLEKQQQEMLNNG